MSAHTRHGPATFGCILRIDHAEMLPGVVVIVAILTLQHWLECGPLAALLTTTHLCSSLCTQSTKELNSIFPRWSHAHRVYDGGRV